MNCILWYHQHNLNYMWHGWVVYLKWGCGWEGNQSLNKGTKQCISLVVCIGSRRVIKIYGPVQKGCALHHMVLHTKFLLHAKLKFLVDIQKNQNWSCISFLELIGDKILQIWREKQFLFLHPNWLWKWPFLSHRCMQIFLAAMTHIRDPCLDSSLFQEYKVANQYHPW